MIRPAFLQPWKRQDPGDEVASTQALLLTLHSAKKQWLEIAGERRNMAEIAIAVLSVALITFGTHGFDIMAKFRDPLRGKNVILKEDKLDYSSKF